ncbi:Uncharacterized protein OBRU01_27014, partial [Operophtera brumata]
MNEECASFMTFLELGISMRRTARMVGVKSRTVQKVLRDWKPFEVTWCTSAREERYIVPTVLRNRHLNAVEVQQQLLETRRDYISDSTVRRRAAEAYLKPRRPASGPNLEREHRVAI